MNNQWREKDRTIDLEALFVYFGYRELEKGEGYGVYVNGKERLVLFNTGEGQRYYSPAKPEYKMTAFDFLQERLSKEESLDKNSIWEKLDLFYSTLEEKGLLRKEGDEMQVSDNMFNHFRDYTDKFGLKADPDTADHPSFTDRVMLDSDGRLCFPLFNLTNTLTGYLREDGSKMELLGDSDLSSSIWFSNVPKKLEGMFVFTDPKEAIAFDRRFGLKNIVYVSLGKINYDTSKILVQIYKRSKVSKIGLSFTGKNKIQGYINDIMLLSFINDTKFLLRVDGSNLIIKFHSGTEGQFNKIYKEVKRYNKSINDGYLDYNDIVDQMAINKKIISFGRKDEMVTCKVPLDITALRYFLWSYYRNYMGKMIDLFKPKTSNWKSDLEKFGKYEGKRIEQETKIAV